jgi:hypothetical protein
MAFRDLVLSIPYGTAFEVAEINAQISTCRELAAQPDAEAVEG